MSEVYGEYQNLVTTSPDKTPEELLEICLDETLDIPLRSHHDFQSFSTPHTYVT